MRKFEAKIRFNHGNGERPDGISTMQAIKSSFPQEGIVLSALFARRYISTILGLHLRFLCSRDNLSCVQKKFQKRCFIFADALKLLMFFDKDIEGNGQMQIHLAGPVYGYGNTGCK